MWSEVDVARCRCRVVWVERPRKPRHRHLDRSCLYRFPSEKYFGFFDCHLVRDLYRKLMPCDVAGGNLQVERSTKLTFRLRNSSFPSWRKSMSGLVAAILTSAWILHVFITSICLFEYSSSNAPGSSEQSRAKPSTSASVGKLKLTTNYWKYYSLQLYDIQENKPLQRLSNNNSGWLRQLAMTYIITQERQIWFSSVKGFHSA